MINNKIYFWASDYCENTGEGRLGRLFVSFLERKYIVIKIINLQNNFFNHKYITPFVGIFFCWIFFFKKKTVAYINYLPMWNSLIFLLLPPNTILGPITGGSNFSKLDKNYSIRKYLFPVLYKISEIIILLRYKNIFFSTELLKKNLFSYTIKKSKFNFVLKSLKIKKKYTKIIDFCLYYRKHSTKISNYPINFIRRLISQKYRVYVVGDRLNIAGVKNLGYVKHSRLLQILSSTRFTISSPENLYTLFLVDCINCNVKILINYKGNNKKNVINFIAHDFNKNFFFNRSDYEKNYMNSFSCFKKIVPSLTS
jgi:hypothetical protein